MKRFLLFLTCAMIFTMGLSAQTNKSRATRKPTATVKKPAQQATATKPVLVDLGLPSGTKWADRNMDATSTTSYGGFYAFGETSTKQTYTEETHTFKSDLTNIAGSEYDAATKKYGKGWSIPTKEQWQELVSNCEQKLAIVNKLLVIQLTGKNGNSIYLPFPTNTIMKMGTPEQSQMVNKKVLSNLIEEKFPSYVRDGLKTYGFDLKVSTAIYQTAEKDEVAGFLGATAVSRSGNLKEPTKDFGIEKGDGYIGFPIRAVFVDASKQ